MKNSDPKPPVGCFIALGSFMFLLIDIWATAAAMHYATSAIFAFASLLTGSIIGVLLLIFMVAGIANPED